MGGDLSARIALQAARNLRGGRGASGLDDEALTREAKAIYQLEFRRENLLLTALWVVLMVVGNAMSWLGPRWMGDAGVHFTLLAGLVYLFWLHRSYVHKVSAALSALAKHLGGAEQDN